MKRTTIVTGLAAVLLACSSGDGSNTSGAPPPDGGTTSGSCLGAGADCTNAPEGCCNGETCVFAVDNPSKSTCAAACLNASQCVSGCCTVLKGGTSAVCAPPTFCAPACVAAGGSCAGNANACCSDAVCVTTATDPGTCASICTINTQCKSLCCAPPANSANRVCSPPSFCP